MPLDHNREGKKRSPPRDELGGPLDEHPTPTEEETHG